MLYLKSSEYEIVIVEEDMSIELSWRERDNDREESEVEVEQVQVSEIDGRYADCCVVDPQSNVKFTNPNQSS